MPGNVIEFIDELIGYFSKPPLNRKKTERPLVLWEAIIDEINSFENKWGPSTELEAIKKELNVEGFKGLFLGWKVSGYYDTYKVFALPRLKKIKLQLEAYAKSVNQEFAKAA
jgi:hypothetical protein